MPTRTERTESYFTAQMKPERSYTFTMRPIYAFAKLATYAYEPFLLKWIWNQPWHRLFHLPHLGLWAIFCLWVFVGTVTHHFELGAYRMKSE